ncbi:MAG: NAD-dependent epimerase/dehydratase family protein [Candidatus Izemoplasmatales bacterium]|nr:NAD-dependent epimerase/dehydratase family protein [Candidatus Izemoplasmatales bacterium]
MKCLVTGATGHIGNVLVKKLFEKGFEVDALVMKNDDYSIIEPYVKIIFGNILDKETLLEVVKGYDLVFHLAGMVEIRFGNKKQLYKVNVQGTKNVLEVCQANQIKRLVYTSSVHAITEEKNNQPMKEPLIHDYKKVKGHYGKTKAIATDMILNQNCPTLETVVVYPAGIIGPYDYKLSNFGQVFTDYLAGRLTAYLKGGYNFVDVRDAADGIIQAALIGRDKQGYILSGHAITVKELLDEIADYTNKKKVRTKIAYWFIKSMSYLAEFIFLILRKRPLFTHYSIAVLNSNHNFDNTKAKTELGFNPRDIKESIKDTVDFAKEHYLVKVGKKYRMKITR